jgi:two-component system CheB/CheR fusion protein
MEPRQGARRARWRASPSRTQVAATAADIAPYRRPPFLSERAATRTPAATMNTDPTAADLCTVTGAPAREKGRGLNSIPIRFALMAGVFTTLCALVLIYYFEGFDGHRSTLIALTLIAVTITLPAFITFVAANKMANSIRALRRSTEAIAAGDINSPVDVNCACEVGGLADSFRAMVDRFNDNVQRMNVLAYTDPVTGLPNRAVISHIFALLAQARTQPGRDCRSTLLFIDLDGFKRVNDTLGHAAGDDLLRQVGQRIIRDGLGTTRDGIDNYTTAFGELRQSCPNKPIFARFASDEFIILLPGAQSECELVALATRILKTIGAPFALSGNELCISASVGICRTPDDIEDATQLLSCADIAMVAAKEAGKNQHRFFDASLRNIAIERNQIEADLRRAIEKDELFLCFQPKLDTATLELTGVEALVRWHHPQKGLIPPVKFIGVAEQSGLMPALGASILHMAAAQARRWADDGTPIRVAVNVSAVQFERPDLVSEILDVLRAHRVEPRLLEIEVTESMVMSDFAAAKRRLEQLAAAGVVIAIDDFGTGYSSLSHLSRLPFDVLKIDKSLVDDVDQDVKAQAIVTAVVHMARALGHKVVAEGIEQATQHAFLERLGCEQVQGYLFGHPMTADKFAEWRSSHAAAHAAVAAS